MRVSEVYGGTYLSGAELQGKTHRLQIEAVAVEEIGDEREKKLVVAFVGAKKNLVLNKTNASALVAAFGDDTDGWPGRSVELFTMPVNFNGKIYDGIRVRVVEQVQTSRLMTETPEPAYTPAANDGVPF